MKSVELALKFIGPQLVGSIQLFMPRLNMEEGFKPNKGEMWTSTAIKNSDGSYTSDWANWCRSEMPEYISKKGILFKILPNVRMLSMNTDLDARRIKSFYTGVKQPGELHKDFPWKEIRKDVDAIHHLPQGWSDGFGMMGTWAAESTVWFDQQFLQKIGECRITPGRKTS